MAKGEATVGELVDMIRRKEIELPEMQRKYVWKASRVRDLLDSLYRGYPSGAILLWDTDENVALQDFAVSQDGNRLHKSKLLLDGQQRLTSLSAVIRNEPVSVRGHTRPIELLFNLEYPEQIPEVTEVDDDAENGSEIDTDSDTEPKAIVAEELQEETIDDDSEASPSEIQQQIESMMFIVKTPRIASRPNWISVSDVFLNDDNVSLIRAAGVSAMDDPRFKKYNDRLNKLRNIRNYSYRLDILERSLSYEEVTEIFVRVNSLGAKLRGSDLALAQVTARWRGSLAIFQSYSKLCEDRGFRLDTGHHLRTIVALATSQSKFRTVSNLSTEDLQSSWLRTTRATDYALNFLKVNCGIVSPTLMSSPFVVTILAYLADKRNFKISPAEAKQLRRYILIANTKGRYTRASSESVLDQDIATLRDGGGIGDLIDRLISQVGRLDIQPGDLVGRNQRSSLFKTMFIKFESDGAIDWKTSVRINLDLGGSQDRLQFHHIFPKALLRGKYPQREIDDLANLAFIGGDTNRFIRDKAPGIYVPQMIEEHGPEMFDVQCIPLKPEILDISSYHEFLAARRILLAKRLNEFLETTVVINPFSRPYSTAL